MVPGEYKGRTFSDDLPYIDEKQKPQDISITGHVAK